MPLSHRPVTDQDLPTICTFAQNEDELFYCFPKAAFPLTPAQLQGAIAQRSDSTVVELDGVVVAADARRSKEDAIREALRAGETTIAALGLGPLLDAGEGRST